MHIEYQDGKRTVFAEKIHGRTIYFTGYHAKSDTAAEKFFQMARGGLGIKQGVTFFSDAMRVDTIPSVLCEVKTLLIDAMLSNGIPYDQRAEEWVGAAAKNLVDAGTLACHRRKLHMSQENINPFVVEGTLAALPQLLAEARRTLI